MAGSLTATQQLISWRDVFVDAQDQKLAQQKQVKANLEVVVGGEVGIGVPVCVVLHLAQDDQLIRRQEVSLLEVVPAVLAGQA